MQYLLVFFIVHSGSYKTPTSTPRNALSYPPVVTVVNEIDGELPIYAPKGLSYLDPVISLRKNCPAILSTPKLHIHNYAILSELDRSLLSSQTPRLFFTAAQSSKIVYMALLGVDGRSWAVFPGIENDEEGRWTRRDSIECFLSSMTTMSRRYS
ncbi:hypothetical protein D9757_011035 [Collybiopsis confluens]|uniref:Uncharacterized protein n=1 Tax=Collybiopsis confluens TaxID=2823264 RepID=A0A8H5LQQ1_9AGAR|nr:hypothetical protein D9757_011035 [Collybiopsis confluens]